MKIIIVFLALLSPSCAWAHPSRATYPITVNVVATHWHMRPFVSGPQQVLDVKAIIGTGHYELQSVVIQAHTVLLTLGNYPARLIRDSHEKSYELSQTYELLMPDGTKQDFVVVGETK